MNISRWLRTIGYLQPIQLYGRLWFKFRRPRPALLPPLPLRLRSGDWIEPAHRTPSMLAPTSFRFLNQQQQLLNEGDWDNPGQSKLWRYNLHYFDDLNAAGATERYRWHFDLLGRWVAENPPGTGTGWEPYPTSLRIVNWIKWSLDGNVLPPECIASLAVQSRWLAKRLEYHLRGNHLFSNAKALLFSGLFLHGEEAERWLNLGLSILAREIPEQILADGGQFERSPMYHSLALEDMLDLCNITTAYKNSLPEEWREMIAVWPERIHNMRHWLRSMCHPDGEIGFFNDTAIGIAPSMQQLELYARRLFGTTADSAIVKDVTWLDPSGYIRVERRDLVLLLDIAPVGPDYLPAHAHADTLSFEMSLFGQRFFVNSGTSLYDVGEERQRRRSTAAHNTVEINGENSSEVWAGFRVGRRARPSLPEIRREQDQIVIAAHHDGYRWLPGSNRHHRIWHIADDSLCIEDRIEGSFDRAVAYYHLHPDVRLEAPSSDGTVLIRHPLGQLMELSAEGGVIQLEASSWLPQFGLSVANTRLAIVMQGERLKTTLKLEQ